MLYCDETLTIYNKYFDRENERDLYLRTVIKGIRWYKNRVVSVDSKGTNFGDMNTIRIPADADFSGKTYVSPSVYKSLTSKSGYFTIAVGDILVRGVATEDDCSAKVVVSKYDTCGTIVSVNDNRTAPILKHWKVTLN